MNLKDPTVQKSMLGAMAVVILSYVYFGTNFMPFNYPVRKAKIEALEKEHAKLTTELEKARKMVGNLAQLEAEYQRLHDQWLVAQDLLPEESEMPDLLRKVTQAGLKSGVQFALFEPEAPRAQDFYTNHPVRVKVRGGYHQVGIFFSRLANLPRIVNVSELELSTAAMQRVKSGEGGKQQAKRIYSVEAEFTLSAYTLLGGVTNESVEAETASIE
jgi:Tfp pilus assembly protein PilO